MKKYTNEWHDSRREKFLVYNFEFDSTIDLCNYLKSARINRKVFPRLHFRNCGSTGSDKLRRGFYQTKSIKEAIYLCENGWNEGYDFFETLKKSLEVTGDRIYFVTGDETDTVNLFVNLSCKYYTTKEAVFNKGVIIQNLIKQLEEKHYKVNLHAFALMCEGNEIVNIVVNLKNKGEKIDDKKTYFALCNPSFLRRLIFRVLETSDVKNKDWAKNYGSPCDAKTIKEFYKTGKLDIVIPQAYEVGIRGDEDINKDWKEFLRHENLARRLINISIIGA